MNTTAKPSGSETILLVDDNPMNLQVLYQTLNSMRAKLLIANNGEAALTIARNELPGLILLDIMMPDIDGFEVCRRLKSNLETQDIPVIFLSALDNTRDKVLGFQVGAVDYISKPFQPEEVKARVTTHLTLHRLKQEVQFQKDQLEQELKIVSAAQRRLLPKTLPTIEGLSLAVHYETSRYAGGDYYDIVQINETTWGFLVADAEGHSTSAAVLMAMTCALFRSFENAPLGPDQVLDHINRHLCKVADPSFVTALFAVYSSADRKLRVSNAGHPAPMVYVSSEKRAVEFTFKGLYPMGVYPYEQVPIGEKTLMPGDRLLFYTDGITERFNHDNKPYGKERLLHRLEAAAGTSAQQTLAVLIEDVERFAGGRPADDDELLLIGVIG